MGRNTLDDDDYYEEGTCPIPQLYEEEKEEFIFYNHLGEQLVQSKNSIGFDLTVTE